mmetsp:Transcript_1515/g.2097  ORF Transcript_1515/g.2097 Transcript_1515/m.2097 type:complete len:241 (+) Transcript_1515:792-1514(+)
MIRMDFGINLRMLSTSSAFRMNDAKIISTFISTPNLMSPMSFSLSAGKVTTAPGKLTPFRLEISPPSLTSHITSVSDTDSTVRDSKPSSINIVIPGLTDLVRSLYVTQNLSSVPLCSNAGSVVIVTLDPVLRIKSPAGNVPVRISGPLVSKAIATSLLQFLAACRTFSMSFLWYSWDPWEKLKRATSSPASRRDSITSIESEPGPRVHTIPVDLQSSSRRLSGVKSTSSSSLPSLNWKEL